MAALTGVEAALADRPAISLDELVAEAAMMTRVDRKYVVPLDAVAPLLRALPPDIRVLEIGAARSFGYSSTYLDTDDQLSFHLAGRSRPQRFKVRTRSYWETGDTWLEVKTRGPRGTSVKERIPHPDGQVAALTPEGRAFVEGGLAAAGVALAAERLTPTLVTTYRRATLHLPGDAARGTIDLEPSWQLLGRRGHRELARPGLAIVETKAGTRPSALDRVLWRQGHRPVRISKYGVGMAALHPDLPRLKWHRVMDRHLGLPAPTACPQQAHRFAVHAA